MKLMKGEVLVGWVSKRHGFWLAIFVCSYGCCVDIAYDYVVPAWFAIPSILYPSSIR